MDVKAKQTERGTRREEETATSSATPQPPPNSWTLAAIATAVKESRHHWKKLVIHPDSDKCVRLRERLLHGSYFIYGRINRVFLDKEKKIENWKESEEDDTSSDLHSCAVINNRLFETSIDGIKKTFNADVLWIDDDKPGKINDKGYMRQIRAVYQVYRCTGDEDCTGKCGPKVRKRQANATENLRRSKRIKDLH